MMSMHRQHNENHGKASTKTSTSTGKKRRLADPHPEQRGGDRREGGYHMERYIEHMEVEETAASNGTRLVIVYIAAFMALLSFIAFLITEDARTLLGTSVLAYPLYKIVDYYFSQPGERR